MAERIITEITKTGVCRKCKAQVKAVLHRCLSVSNASNFAWVCPGCKVTNPFGKDKEGVWISKSKIEDFCRSRGMDMEKLPIVQPPGQMPRCVRCGERGAEVHHWSPRGIFGDEADSWPVDFLCKPCHSRWHKMVTPQLTP